MGGRRRGGGGEYRTEGGLKRRGREDAAAGLTRGLSYSSLLTGHAHHGASRVHPFNFPLASGSRAPFLVLFVRHVHHQHLVRAADGEEPLLRQAHGVNRVDARVGQGSADEVTRLRGGKRGAGGEGGVRGEGKQTSEHSILDPILAMLHLPSSPPLDLPGPPTNQPPTKTSPPHLVIQLHAGLQPAAARHNVAVQSPLSEFCRVDLAGIMLGLEEGHHGLQAAGPQVPQLESLSVAPGACRCGWAREG